MANVDPSNDGLVGFDYDSRGYLTSQSWPVPVDHDLTHHHRQDDRRDISALQASGHLYEQTVAAHDPNLIAGWQFQPLHSHIPQYNHGDTTSAPPFTSTYGVPLQASPIELMPSDHAHLDHSLLDGSYLSLSAPVDMMPFNYQGFHTDLMPYPQPTATSTSMTYQSHVLPDHSPADTCLEVGSLPSSGSDNGWSMVDNRCSVDSFSSSFREPDLFINPNQTLHNRTPSESSYSDLERPRTSLTNGGFVDLSQSISSPSSVATLESEFGAAMVRRRSRDDASRGSRSPTAVSPVTIVRPVPAATKATNSPTRSPTQASGSPPSRKGSRRSPIAAKNAETKVRKQTGKPETTEKRVGKRKGPLKPDQRKQASEIRKLRACLRCKFLKKTCDKGEPCAGCKPSHARLWQVPCTRIDIKEIGYFMKDWTADYERHVSLGFSVGNIKGFSTTERTLFVTHGFGQMLPINAREVYVRDDSCFNLDWVETIQGPTQYETATAKLSAGMEGISTAMLSDYLDRHIDGNGSFEKFVDDYFEGTPFLTQMLKTAFRYYFRTQIPVIRKALKLVLAYNLTLHVTMVEGIGEEEIFHGKIKDESSKFYGKTMAPVMINFQVKCAMASMWRELQKDVLEELSTLYSSVYSGDKLKNWPTIFILASILLAIWEEMQFDCHYRVPDPAAVDKFCTDMETTPVGVIVGLFQAISQKLPPFIEWDSQKHHHLLNSNADVCNTMTEVRQHVTQHEAYLRTRPNVTFNRNDFDCLSNKFVSKLVIRAN